MIHMKCQALFSLKNKKENGLLSITIMLGTLRVHVVQNILVKTKRMFLLKQRKVQFSFQLIRNFKQNKKLMSKSGILETDRHFDFINLQCSSVSRLCNRIKELHSMQGTFYDYCPCVRVIPGFVHPRQVKLPL